MLYISLFYNTLIYYILFFQIMRNILKLAINEKKEGFENQTLVAS